MKVLWMTNFALPSVARAIGMEERVYEGWLVGLSERLLKDKGIELFCVFPQNIKSEMVEGKCENLRYFGYPQKSNGLRYNKELLKMLENVIQKVEPEIVHINGSEYPQVFSMVQACDNAGMINSNTGSGFCLYRTLLDWIAMACEIYSYFT